MKRSGFGPRTTPLARNTELDSRSELTRSPTPRTGPPTPQQQRRKEQLAAWVDLRLLVLERDGDACVRCGQTGAPLDVHHRRRRGQGGDPSKDHAANLVTLCGFGNNANADWCHGQVHAYPSTHGRAGGWMLLEGESPYDVPVRYSDAHGGGFWLLDDDGYRERVAA